MKTNPKNTIMKKVYLAALLMLAGFSIAMLSSCRFECVKGSGVPTTETRKMVDFTKIEISGNFKVVLKQDSSLTLNITADDNLMKLIKTSVEDGKLKIHTKKNMCNSGDMMVTIGVRHLEELKTSGAIEVSSDGLINVQDLTLDMAGANKMTLDLNANNLTTTGSGATELNLKGQATSHNVDISGVGKIYALDFVVGDYDVETSGASHCDINVLKTLTVHSSGASEIRYRGNPSSINNDKSGASSLEKIN